ncbi:MAG: LTA synthase family protein [Bacteroidales bacterium]|nr:LTA synthase family protein [Bacteroidales bacterium]
MVNLREPVQLIFRSLRRFLSLSLILASMIFMVRLYEFVLTATISHYPPGSVTYMLIGLKYDLILYLRISAIMIVPYLIIAYFNQRAAKYFFVVTSILLILCDILLVKYFSTARVPLGADLFGYSFKETQHTVAASGELRFGHYFLIILYLAVMVRVFIRHVYFRLKPWMMAALALLMCCSWLPSKSFRLNPSDFDNEFSRFVATNKLDFFIQGMADRYLTHENSGSKKFTFETLTLSPEGNPFIYVDPEFPFLHTETTPDILADCFNLGSIPPNLVFIVVEGLGRAYSGEGAYLGSFTPFLDSLMQKSLYWENCLSTSGRTFQVLPSLLASAPFGDHGFAALGENMPDHLSLISILKKQAGFTTSFVYGGDAQFDNMDIFLHRQGIDQIIEGRNFGSAFTTLPVSGKGFTWGYCDLDIFKKYLENLKSSQDSLRTDVLLTLAMHDPFNVPDQEIYNQKFIGRLDDLKLSDKARAFNKQYSKQLASVLYFDEALRYFFNEFSKLKSFANTIFIITGDHRMPEIPIATQIDRFHVPLVIYSPLLKKSEKFSAVVTHFDITPSIVALFNGKNYITRPSVSSWIGHGLDHSVSFRSLNSYPLMRNTNEIVDYLGSNLFLSNQIPYRVYPNLDIEPIEMSDTVSHLITELNNFKRINQYVCLNNKLIPDSIKIGPQHKQQPDNNLKK